MPDETKPALTPEEWAQGRYREDAIYGFLAVERTGERLQIEIENGERSATLARVLRPAALMALGNAALPDGDPNKITSDDVNLVLVAAQQYADIAKWVDQGWIKGPVTGERYRQLEAECLETYEKLRALLPPE
jgi:hypothetical protein